jgi:hypothetical protein
MEMEWSKLLGLGWEGKVDIFDSLSEIIEGYKRELYPSG